MSEPTDTPDAPDDLGEPTDISAADLDVDADAEKPASSDAEAFRDAGDTQGGTGGLDAGGAG